MAFPIEEIPSESLLLLRVHKKMFLAQHNRPSSACFRHYELSTNWIKYSSVEHTRNEDSGAVVSVVSAQCIVLGQEVVHAPINEGQEFGPNQAHTHVVGEKPKEVRDQFARLVKVEWRLP